VTLLFFASREGPVPTLAELPFCRRIIPVRAPKAYTPDKILRGLLGRWPLPVLNLDSGHMKAALAELLAAEGFDLIQMEHVSMAATYVPALRRATRAPIIFDWHNIDSEVMDRYGKVAASPLRKWYASHTARRLAALEEQVLSEAFGHIVCSVRERDQLRAIAPQARVAVIENGVDVEYLQSPAPAPESRRHIVFVGSMNYHANAGAALHFVQTVWPAVRARFPEWQMAIVGSNPTPEVLALHGENGVEVTGTVPDVRRYYRGAVAAIVPLAVGGGTRLKILEAMAAGVPVVSTAIGAEGLSVSDGREILIADDVTAWVRGLEQVALDEALRGRLVAAGLELVRSRYDWKVIGDSLCRTYRDWVQQPAGPESVLQA
jgi:glycosyltransferase involved in cell wall biosynthesis